MLIILKRDCSNAELRLIVESIESIGVRAHVFVQGEGRVVVAPGARKHLETQSIENMTQLVDLGNQYGIPVLAVTAVGKDMARDARYFRLACRMCAELGAHFVKSYYIDDGFETVTASCPVPIVMAGGKKLAELDALTMAYNAVDQGASGVDMGRNIFQSDAPISMIKAVGKVVHEKMKPKEAFQLFKDLKQKELGKTKKKKKKKAR